MYTIRLGESSCKVFASAYAKRLRGSFLGQPLEALALSKHDPYEKHRDLTV
jgi:hypothetical protein